MRDRELDASLGRFLDGEPEPEDGPRLAAAMREDPAFAEEVRRLLATDDMLRQECEPDRAAFADGLLLRMNADRGDDLAEKLASVLPQRDRTVGVLPRTAAKPRRGRTPTSRPLVAIVILAVATVSAGASFLLLRGSPPAASLTRVQDAWWAPGLGVELGERLQPDRWASLESGMAELTFSCGARATVRGPSLFRLCSDRCLLLSEGAVSVVAPAGAEGFTVLTPGSEFVDRGTEFAVLVPSTRTAEVHVRRGRVEIFRSGGSSMGGESRELAGGEAARVDAFTGEVAALPLSRAAFREIGPASKTFVAYRTRRGTAGNQFYGGKLGHDFIVHEPITVARLGVFDSDGDGLARPLACELWRRDDRGTPDDPRDDAGDRMLASVRFGPESPGELVDSNRFKPLPRPLRLEPGAYSVVAWGYGRGEPNGNDYGGRAQRHLKARDGGGSVSFVGSGRFEFDLERPRPPDSAAFPEIVDDGDSPDRYSAGTFEFVRAP